MKAPNSQLRLPLALILLACITLIALLLPSVADAQNREVGFKREAPDMDAIRQAINDRRSQYYYPRLMEEYTRNDTLMKLDKFRHLYFGYMLQEDYNPYRPKSYPEFMRAIFDKKDLTRQECDSVIKYSEIALQDNPFDLHRIINLISALKTKGKNNLAKIWQYKLDYILMAIVSSGTGADEDNAWYVIQPEHEYVLFNAMGLVVDNHVFHEPCYEYITATDSSGNKSGYYFNIETLLEEYYRKFPEQ